MSKPCYVTPTRTTDTQYNLRPLDSQLAPVGICAWFAMHYLITGKAMNSLAHLADIVAELPHPNSFKVRDSLAGVYAHDYAYLLGLHGFEINEMLEMTPHNKDGELLGIMLRRMVHQGIVREGDKLLIHTECHAIAMTVHADEQAILVDQVTSCTLDRMPSDYRFQKWYWAEDYIIFRVYPTSEHPSTRLHTLVRESFQTQARVREVARKLERSLSSLRKLSKRGMPKDRSPQARTKLRTARSNVSLFRLWLAEVAHQAEARKRLAQKAGAVFEPRLRARITPRASGAPRRRALQPLRLDRAATARVLAEREATWAAERKVEQAAASEVALAMAREAKWRESSVFKD